MFVVRTYVQYTGDNGKRQKMYVYFRGQHVSPFDHIVITENISGATLFDTVYDATKWMTPNMGQIRKACMLYGAEEYGIEIFEIVSPSSAPEIQYSYIVAMTIRRDNATATYYWGGDEAKVVAKEEFAHRMDSVREAILAIAAISEVLVRWHHIGVNTREVEIKMIQIPLPVFKDEG